MLIESERISTHTPRAGARAHAHTHTHTHTHTHIYIYIYNYNQRLLIFIHINKFNNCMVCNKLMKGQNKKENRMNTSRNTFLLP